MKEILFFLFLLMIRRPPRSTRVRSSAASDVYKRQHQDGRGAQLGLHPQPRGGQAARSGASSGGEGSEARRDEQRERERALADDGLFRRNRHARQRKGLG